jgi:fatty-acyl-CoA synthase
VIKSGGEWISSVELENLLAGHPDLLEAAVIGVPDDRWQERPAACVVAKPGTAPSFTELRAYLSPQVAKWWLPERWALLPEIPKTSVVKFDKKALRELYARRKLATEYVGSRQPIRDPRRSPGRQPA